MNERDFSVKLMGAAKKEFRGCVVIKHADRFTRNIPDIQILWAGRTAWIETKFLRKGRRLKDIVEKGQLLFGHELATVGNGRALIVVHNAIDCRVEVWTPRALFHHLWPGLAAGVGTNPFAFDPGCDPSFNNALRALLANGMLYWPFVLEETGRDLPIRVLRDGFRRD